jgi:hypothetical protein
MSANPSWSTSPDADTRAPKSESPLFDSTCHDTVGFTPVADPRNRKTPPSPDWLNPPVSMSV